MKHATPPAIAKQVIFAKASRQIITVARSP
jgi:hypothetical protein